ncbi:phosphocarrier protein HPr /dihydroxyacetone kinase DhaM subunit [Saccharopolyspora erythraea NRRL 2338]|uniref:Phosphocarrier protein HPr n=2 Tax=Saccharopolyspora erythraea TaxID=1836 RepID=A4FMZ4_SACEN|nr:dihydroxyacetone kinase phosphoryl donor subunit DhaM [Saccharopolyspora erythraea]EQD84910.1 PTS sugar transporter subunit IIA [Saccharopolyspora erythraea D]PFG99061.1 phosphocarrier protein HPr /dihydroxyacetone kinase DhaM subunit [Saccharopolyspora erythraea NRRL 2338]QRK89026.1 PTS-dependent dihydroxyacetone kinase phosphotransferase subunit DhaM [Saccharopolyspora erythraea]CAM05419.1 phosphoenolpyruvate-protein phosphotransferase [Saccharopolyspora erythraea NRRL 2338]
MKTVGLVIVSHSEKLAEGVVELARQMAPEVRVVAAGGLDDGSVGTDFERVSAALSDADTGAGAVLLYDLGSAQMVAELAVESLGDPRTAIVADGPLVEGAVAGAVAAQGGKDLKAVVEAVQTAGGPSELAGGGGEAEAPPQEEVREELELANEVGLHARPAALVARCLTGLDTDVTISLGDKEADAASVLGVMGLGARKGHRIVLRASGPDAREAVQRILDLASRNFDE